MNCCWIYRKGVAWAADSQAPVPPWVERHLQSCAACRHFHRTELQLTAALSQSDAPLKEFPPFLHARIITNLKAESAQAAPRVWVGSWLRVAIVPTLALLIVAYVVWKPVEHRIPVASVPAPATRTEPVRIPALDAAQLLAWSGKLDEPLESEFHAVVSDAKTALTALSENFVPRTFLAKAMVGTE